VPTNVKKTVNRKQNKQRFHALIIAGIGLLFTLFTVLVQPLTSVKLWLSDQLFITEPPSPNIVVVGIDDITLQNYGKWSDWSRSLHAQAIDNLKEAGAKVIGFDILFVDISADDAVLAEAVANAGNVILPVVGSEQMPVIDNKITYDYFLEPVAYLNEVCQATGHANIVPDRDGKVRRLPLIVQDREGHIYPSFDLTILHAVFSMPLPEDYTRENSVMNLVARDIPVDKNYQLRVNFSSDNSSRPYLSYGDVISGNFDPSVVDKKIVIIGMTATGEYDAWAIPTSTGKVPGVYIHAATMDTILRSQFLTEVGRVPTLLIMILLTVIACLTLPFLKLKWGTALIVVLLLAYVGIGVFIFDSGYILNLVYPPFLLPILYVSSIITAVLNEQSDKRFVKELFGRYVSSQVADQILSLADSGNLQLGGEQKEVTILFADIRGFTKMSEQLSPEAIVSMLNTYLSIMIEKVLENGGMVNKFAGDNIMAVWNAPQEQKEHARLAAKAAWEAQLGIAEIQKNDPSLPRALFGVGINTGQAVAGNVGSSGRSEYTVIGDAVNLASRICSGTTGGEVWLGPETYRQAKDYVEVTALEPQEFKGKSERVPVFRLNGLK
jgi:adenylate cyclase